MIQTGMIRWFLKRVFAPAPCCWTYPDGTSYVCEAHWSRKWDRPVAKSITVLGPPQDSLIIEEPEVTA